MSSKYLKTIQFVAGGDVYHPLPIVTTADNDKIMSVVDGEWTLTDSPIKPEEEKTVTAGTFVTTVTPTTGYTMSKVIVNPTPSQAKTATPTTSQQTITPDSGKLLSSVVVNAIQTETKTAYWEGETLEITPSSGKTMSKVTVQEPPLTSIVVTTQPTATSYSKGDAFSPVGMVVTAYYANGTSAQINGYTYSPQTLSSAGDVTITISYTERGVTKTTTLTVSVSDIICTWSGGTDAQIVKMVEAADAGKINLADYWAVGDTRTVSLSAMSATGVGESHAAQTVELVLMHAGDYDLNTAVASGRSKCSFVVGMKDGLATAGYMNASDTNSGSWSSSKRRAWCNNIFKNAIPSTLLPIFKQFKTITAATYNGSTNQTTVDYFALPAAKEIFGGTASSAGSATSYSNLTEFNALFQFDWYKTSANRIKKYGTNGSSAYWWERSPYYNYSSDFCYVSSDGSAYGDYAGFTNGLAPFGCI